MDADGDPVLARIERGALWACGVMAAVAAAVSRGWNAPLAVIGGGLLVAVSYRGIKGGVDALTAATAAGSDRSVRPAVAWGLVKFLTRYAILAAAAYVMMARLRLHPGWLFAGASALVAAIGAEAFRGARGTRGSGRIP